MLFGIAICIPSSLCFFFWKCFLYLFLCFLVNWLSNVQHKDARHHHTKIPVFLYLNGLVVLSQEPKTQHVHCKPHMASDSRQTGNSYHVETASSLLASFPGFPAFQAVLSQHPACSLQATHGQRLETDNSYHVATASLLTSFPGFPACQHQRRGSPLLATVAWTATESGLHALRNYTLHARAWSIIQFISSPQRGSLGTKQFSWSPRGYLRMRIQFKNVVQHKGSCWSALYFTCWDPLKLRRFCDIVDLHARKCCQFALKLQWVLTAVLR